MFVLPEGSLVFYSSLGFENSHLRLNFCGSSQAPSEHFYFIGFLLKDSRRFKKKKWRTKAPLSFGTNKSPRPTRVKEICSIFTFESGDSKLNLSFFRDFELKFPRTLDLVLKSIFCSTKSCSLDHACLLFH